MRCHRKQSLVIPLGNVTLRGDEAGRVAWAAPGVAKVENNLTVSL